MSEEVDRVAMASDLKSLEKGLDTKMSDLLAVVKEQAEQTRRHFDVVAEEMRSEFKVVAERTMATNQKVDRLIAQNAIEHAAFVEAIADHEVRQRVIENMHEPHEGS